MQGHFERFSVILKRVRRKPLNLKTLQNRKICRKCQKSRSSRDTKNLRCSFLGPKFIDCADFTSKKMRSRREIKDNTASYHKELLTLISRRDLIFFDVKWSNSVLCCMVDYFTCFYIGENLLFSHRRRHQNVMRWRYCVLLCVDRAIHSFHHVSLSSSNREQAPKWNPLLKNFWKERTPSHASD